MSCQKEYLKWLESGYVDADSKAELEAIKGNEDEIKSRFISMLEFGTGGLRGILGVGLNRMNIYTVRYATQGLANLIIKQGGNAKERGVSVAHDSRIMSPEFAIEVACVLAANGIKAFVFDELRPTPELSFSVRELGCIAGVNVTASHNPKQYNGYKVYWEDGAQIALEQAEIVYDEIMKSDVFADVKTMPIDEAVAKGLVTYIGKEIDEKFLGNALAQVLNPDEVKKAADSLKIVYTPFHGAGYRLVPEVLKRLGIKNVFTVKEQMVLDGNFPTVKSPNPEEKEGFTLAIEIAKKEGIDLIFGTDPDADRVGLVVKNSDGEYIVFNGNQIGAVLLDYVIKARIENNKMPKNACVVKTIVTSEIAKAICKKNNVSIVDVLTGFKFIGEKIKEWETSKEYEFIFGYEESYGYLVGTYARDKDAVVSSMLIAEAAAYYHNRGMTLYDALIAIYEKYGNYLEKTISITMEGLDGIEKTKNMMKKLRTDIHKELAGIKVVHFRDYLSGEITNLTTKVKSSTLLPKSDVVYYELEDKSAIVVRPSGTEPKVKIYFLISGESYEICKQKTESLENFIKKNLI